MSFLLRITLGISVFVIGVIVFPFWVRIYYLVAKNVLNYTLYWKFENTNNAWFFGVSLALPFIVFAFFRSVSPQNLLVVGMLSFLGISVLPCFPFLYHEGLYQLQENKTGVYGVNFEGFSMEFFALIGSVFGMLSFVLFRKSRQKETEVLD